MTPDDLLAREKKRVRQERYRKRHAEGLAAINRERCKRYYVKHRTERISKARQYERNNREIVNAHKIRRYEQKPEMMMLKSARQRARRAGVPCTITLDDIRACIPADLCCPITGNPFRRGYGAGKHTPDSMSLDKIDPSKGYVPGNIAVISNFANSLKSDCIDEEVFDRIAAYLEGSLSSSPGTPQPPAALNLDLDRGQRYRARHPERILLKKARCRAKDLALPFDLTVQDILDLMPSDMCCPITRAPFVFVTGRARRQSISLDRIHPEKGYTKGNVALISHWANVLKGSCVNPDVFRRISNYLSDRLSSASIPR